MPDVEFHKKGLDTMPRIIVFGKSKRRTTRRTLQILRAFREQGCETFWLNPLKIERRKGRNANRYISKKIHSFKPDIILILSLDIPLQTLQEISNSGIATVMFYFDWNPEILGSVIERAALVDIFLLSCLAEVEKFHQAGVRPIYFPDACDHHAHRKRNPVLPIWKSDLAFIGEAKPLQSRVPLIQTLRHICHVKVYGKNWKAFGVQPTLRSVGPRGYGLICAGAKIMLGCDCVHHEFGCWSNRLWLTLGCGGFLLTNYVPGMDDIFKNREHLVWYHDEDECISLVREYLDKPEERIRIAEQGYRFVHDNHTFHHFAGRVLELCEDFNNRTIDHGRQINDFHPHPVPAITPRRQP